VKNQPELFNYLAKTQTPKARAGHAALLLLNVLSLARRRAPADRPLPSLQIMIIGCADSRVDPAVLFGSEPGELFQVRSVANLVPPYERGGNFHGTSAALEFAVTALKVEHVIVLGHSKCGGIKALVQRRLVENRKEVANDFIDSWVSIADPAVERTRLRTKGMDFAAQCTDCEQTSIDQSLQNLLTFPWIESAVNDGRLQLHGWYYDVSENPSLKMWNLDMKRSNEAIIA
jgi:carbonic anhydrase